METLDELLAQLDNLPDGYISKKTIKGKVYTYLQYFSNGKIVSKYVSSGSLKTLEAKLAKRKEIEAKIKELKGDYVEMSSLTKREKELTGFLMCGGRVAAKLYKGDVIEIDRRYCPLSIIRTKDFKSWLLSRCIDTNRENAHALFYSLQIKESNNHYIPLYVNACTVTDNYWFKPSGAVTKYSELKFGKNLYANVAFTGEKRQYPWGSCRTPEITTGGSTEKCWKFEDNYWYLYKKQTPEQVFSTLFTVGLAEDLNIRTIRYYKVDGGLKCRNFATKCNFDNLSAVTDDINDFTATFEGLKALGDKNLAKDYLKIRYLDAVVGNTGRSIGDMGILRSRKNGEIICLAPGFDYSNSLFASCSNLDGLPENDEVIKNFCNFLHTSKEARKFLRQAKVFKVKKDAIRRAILKADPKREEYKDICNYILARVSYIKKHRKK